jgi:hypothetical protein
LNLAPYRKFVIAICAAAVTIAHAFGLAVAEEISSEVIGIFDGLAAILIYAVPNETVST